MKTRILSSNVLGTAAALTLAASLTSFAATSADYAQRNHLLIQWDGIDNIGMGTHDPNATVWKNIAPGATAYDLTLTANGSWSGGKALSVNGASANYTAGPAPAAKTIEVVFKMNKGGRILFWGGNDTTRQIVVFTAADNPQCLFTGRTGLSGPTVLWNTDPTAIRSAAAVFANGADKIATATYADGEARTNDSFASNWGGGGARITIGNYGTDTRYPWSGEVYAIRLYDTELTPAEIATNHDIDLERFAGELPMPKSTDYVQDGLVAQWDGIDNAGTGTHDPAATVWKNLATTGSAYDLTLTANGSWNAEGNALVTTDLAATGASDAPAYKTIEVVFKKVDNLGRILFSGGDTRHMVIFDNDTERAYFTSSESTKQILHPFNSAEVSFIAAQYGDNGAVAHVFKDATLREDAPFSRDFSPGSGLSVGGRVASNTYGWRGEIYAIRLYDRRLTRAELARNHLIDCRRFLTSSSYIQKNLVGYWDGLDNAGVGLHDSTANTWKNLASSGSTYDLSLGTGKWSCNALMCMGSGVAAQGTSVLPNYSSFEAVVANGANTNTASAVVFSNGKDRYLVLGVAYASVITTTKTTAFNNQISGRNSFAWLRSGANVLLNGGKIAYGSDAGTTWALASSSGFFVGARKSDGRYPYNGAIFAIRAYDGNITDAQAVYNYRIDRTRFGLPKRAFTWSGAVNEFFATNGNWSVGLATDGVPSVDDAVVLPGGNSYTVTLDDEWVVGEISVGAGATLALSLPRDGNNPDGAVPLTVMGALSAESGAELALNSRLFDKWHHLETATLIDCGEDSTAGLQTLASSLNTTLGRNLASVSSDGKRLVYTAPPPDGTVFIVR